VAQDPRVDALRAKMQVSENPAFTQDYYDPAKRYIGNAVQVFFTDGTSSRRVAVDFPIGHRKRRAEGIPVLIAKFAASVAGHFAPRQAALIQERFADKQKLLATPVNEFAAAMVKNA
jgi:2-methylcitrate dehydratase